MAQDIEWKGYFADNDRYADIINGIGCGGRQIVTGSDLHELDTQIGFLSGPRFIRGRNLKKRSFKKESRKTKIRDALRKAAFGVNFAIIGIENQESIDYSMPLSRMHPVVTFFLYSGVEEWDGPESLHEMIDFADIPEKIIGMVPDYRINLVEIKKT